MMLPSLFSRTRLRKRWQILWRWPPWIWRWWSESESCVGGEGKGEPMASEVCMDKSMCKIWTAGSSAQRKRMGSYGNCSLHLWLPHNAAVWPSHPEAQTNSRRSSTDPVHQYIETGWKDQKFQRQYKIGQTYVVTMTSWIWTQEWRVMKLHSCWSKWRPTNWNIKVQPQQW